MPTLQGVGGAPGIVIGPAARLDTHTAGAAPVDLDADGALARFAQAQSRAAERLRALAAEFRAEGREAEAGIFDAQAMLVEDEFLTDEVTRLVKEDRERLEDALDETTAQMRTTLEALDDAYLRERAADMDAIGHEIHLALRGESGATVIPVGAIILADDLTPTQTAGLRGGAVAGFATAFGGPTGHTAILARSLGIPAAVGLGAELADIVAGTQLILDGGAAQLIVAPSDDEIASYTQSAADQQAAFVRRAFELGASTNMIEAIWQVMPTTRNSGAVWTTTGDLALPLLPTEKELVKGDVLWTDVSITYDGYCSDFGRTWVVGEEPTARQHAQYAKWREILDAVLAVTRAGATCGDLARAAIAANGGQKPWLPHFYLGHGIGTNAAEMPMIGTDLGAEFDDNFVLPAGMLLVLEPVVWEDGTGGYRSEEIIVITEDGHQSITDYPYAPYGVS